LNYTTGDAAGQNLTGKATAAACAWIVQHYPAIEHFFLESNFATDKKSSQRLHVGREQQRRATVPRNSRIAACVSRGRSTCGTWPQSSST
jgi:hydroxymethylglutaryl-CoA reductase (NADPH)